MADRLTYGELLKLKRLTTPTLYNGWEQITRHDRRTQTNRAETRDFMPQFGPMVGYAVTVVCEPSNPIHQKQNPDAPRQYREYIASIPGPKIVVVADLDKPNHIGSFWGEVNASTHGALGCVGTITDGAVRDLAEMTSLGFKALASRLCVGHAYSWPVRWNCEVEVFGCTVRPGDLIHADQHGFLVIPEDDQAHLFEAGMFMDGNECDTVISAARDSHGKSLDEVLQAINEASAQFGQASRAAFGKTGEW
jgi:4-hydroxy-4-methyl-2-oxoglutarate aldolase